MIPLCTTDDPPPIMGMRIGPVGAPCVAQRVWPPGPFSAHGGAWTSGVRRFTSCPRAPGARARPPSTVGDACAVVPRYSGLSAPRQGGGPLRDWRGPPTMLAHGLTPLAFNVPPALEVILRAKPALIPGGGREMASAPGTSEVDHRTGGASVLRRLLVTGATGTSCSEPIWAPAPIRGHVA